MKLKILIVTVLLVLVCGQQVYAEELVEIDTTGYLSEVDTTLYPSEAFNMSSDEYDAVLKIIHGEAGTEGLLGRLMVAEVICNRACFHECFPDTLVGVVSQRGQFSTWRPRNKYVIDGLDITALDLLKSESKSAMEGYALVDPSEYVYFCTPSAYKRIGHQYMKNVFTYQGHVFGTR